MSVYAVVKFGDDFDTYFDVVKVDDYEYYDDKIRIWITGSVYKDYSSDNVKILDTSSDVFVSKNGSTFYVCDKSLNNCITVESYCYEDIEELYDDIHNAVASVSISLKHHLFSSLFVSLLFSYFIIHGDGITSAFLAFVYFVYEIVVLYRVVNRDDYYLFGVASNLGVGIMIASLIIGALL